MSEIYECFWCEKEFIVKGEDIGSFQDLRYIDDENFGGVLVYFTECPHCGESTDLYY